MFSKFFIDRPIFATVLSIFVTLAGGIALFALPVTQYPEITPPTVEVSAVYPGANAQVVSDTVASPIEQQVNGVEGMIYMSSQSTNDGAYSLTITFRPGSNLNLAQVLVQNRVALAQPILPELVRRRGVTVKKKSPSVLMMVNLSSPNGTRDNLYLSNYATIQLRDELSRLAGVGDISFLGQRDYSMRVWLYPEQLAKRRLDASDVVHAIERQNVQVAAGQVGQPPAPTGQAFQYTMTTLGRLSDPEEFANMVVAADDKGRIVRLRDVARVELGALAYDQICTLDGKPSVGLSIYQLPGTNALQTATLVRRKMEELQSRFPNDVKYDIVYDTTPFIQESVNEVFTALRDAVLLVALVVLVFLQGWRAAIIPLVAVPVAIVGAFAAMVAVGFSLNTLTLFGLVLAVGIVVDDAIVVVEAVERQIEQGLSPRDAAIRAMEQVSGPVIAVGLVLTAVFIPCAFISGIVGQFFRQFALTIAISTAISAFNSLTLSPALAVLLLKSRSHGQIEALPKLGLAILGGWAAAYFGTPLLDPVIAPRMGNLPFDSAWISWLILAVAGAIFALVTSRIVNWMLASFFRAFDWFFEGITKGYVASVGWLLRASPVMMLLYGGLLFATYRVFVDTPTGFIPSQDKGYLLVNVRLPDSSSLERTSRALAQIEAIADKTEGVRHTVAIAGNSILLGAGAPNFGSLYVMLDDFHHRKNAAHSADQIAAQLQQAMESQVAEAVVNVVGAPPIEGLGAAGGFRIVIQDRGGDGLPALQSVSQKIVDEGNETPQLSRVFTSFRADTTWLYLDIDRDEAEAKGVSMADVFSMLQVNLGTLYVNDFNKFGRTWQVNVQADARRRMRESDLSQLYVRSHQGRMVPLMGFARLRQISGPAMLNRYNLYPSAIVNADVAPGASSGEAISKLHAIATQNVGRSMKPEWTELAYLQLEAGNTATYAFILAVVLVFLVLAAQYESWALPLAVILVVPMCLLCSILGVIWSGMDINIFTQIGFIVLVGLACKNAILIVEYARAKHDEGATKFAATLEACRLRLRPIIMTSLAFILGVVPLVLGQGAGAEMRRTLGTAVFYGMLGVTVFGVFLTPVFFFVIQAVVDWARPQRIQNRPAIAPPSVKA
jgi:multidrug efflux pump